MGLHEEEAMVQLWHISFSSANRLPLFSTEALRREAVGGIAKWIGNRLVMFSIVDEHIHLVSIGSQEQTRRLRQSVHRRLNSLAEVQVSPSWVGPVKDRKHLLTLFRYHLRQVIKHEVKQTHPGLWSGSCFQDLIGARFLEGLQLQLGLILPRQRIEVLACNSVGLKGWDIRPIEDRVLRLVGSARIMAAAAAAAAARPGLEGNSREEVIARQATARLGVTAEISKQELCWALGLTRQGLFTLLRREAPRALMWATRIRLALEIEVERR